MITIKHLYDLVKNDLELESVGPIISANSPLKTTEIERPGLALSGYLKGFSKQRILVFGKVEMAYLNDLPSSLVHKKLEAILSETTPCVIITRKLKPPLELLNLCKKHNITLFRTSLKTTIFINRLVMDLTDLLAPNLSLHGTLVETFGCGLLIQGESEIGKSEAALGLIEKGHRLVSDDNVLIKKKENSYLEGTGPSITKHLLEIRGIGILNVANLYGPNCISEKKNIDLIVTMESWDTSHFYDRIGLENNFKTLLNIRIPSYTLPVKPGRDIVLLLETIVLNHRLKGQGYNSAKEFNIRLLNEISKKQLHDQHLNTVQK